MLAKLVHVVATFRNVIHFHGFEVGYELALKLKRDWQYCSFVTSLLFVKNHA